jgi:hypothetical protein
MRTLEYYGSIVTEKELSAWAEPFPESLTESELQRQVCLRILETFGDEAEIREQSRLADRSIPDLLIRCSAAHQWDTVVEIKRDSVNLNFDVFDQLICYGEGVAAANSMLRIVKLVLFNGTDAYVGHVLRSSHSTMNVIIAQDPLEVYKK